MKIYQVIEYGGQYEDAYEYVKGTYINKENALAYMSSLENERDEFIENLKKQVDICSQCLELFENIETEQEFEIARDVAIKKCCSASNFELEEDCYSYVYCGYFREFEYDLYDGRIANSSYEIKEFEVLDA